MNETKSAPSAADLTELKQELKELQSNIRELEITNNRRRFARNTISDGDMMLHKKWGDRIREIESILSGQKSYSRVRAQEDQIFKDLLKESLGSDDYYRIMQEYNRRIKSEPSHKVTLKNKDSGASEYKKKLLETLELLKEIRQTLTQVNMDGCEKFDVSEFMKTISPVNRIVPTVADITKQQRSI